MPPINYRLLVNISEWLFMSAFLTKKLIVAHTEATELFVIGMFKSQVLFYQSIVSTTSLNSSVSIFDNILFNFSE